MFNVKIINNDYFIPNFNYTLRWYGKHYPKDMFEYILIEQDTSNKINIPQDIIELLNLKIVFIKNPRNFNRGWGYNVVAKHYATTDILIFCDSEIILNNPENINIAVDMCKNNHALISPYKYVHYTTPIEREVIMKGIEVKHIVRGPVTISGGICVVNKEKYLKIGGYEEYQNYGGEDRVLDVFCLAFYPDECKMLDGYGVHLYHPTNKGSNPTNFRKMITELRDVYSCNYNPSLKPTQYIHDKCNHSKKEKLIPYVEKRLKTFGNIDLYK